MVAIKLQVTDKTLNSSMVTHLSLNVIAGDDVPHSSQRRRGNFVVCVPAAGMIGQI